MDYFEAVYNGLSTAPTIMGTLFICSGMIYLLEVSGAFGASINLILKKTQGREFSVVCIFYTVFVIFGVLGYGEAAYPFFPLAVTIGFALGYDRMVGTALAIIGSTVGFTSGLMNTFTTGVAQQIVGPSPVLRDRISSCRSGCLLRNRPDRTLRLLPQDQKGSRRSFTARNI